MMLTKEMPIKFKEFKWIIILNFILKNYLNINLKPIYKQVR